jgi:hypothetical protein
MNSGSHSGRYLHRCRTFLIVAFIIPTLLFAFGVRAARAGVYKLQPILCDGVDYDTDAPILCALPKDTTKELSSTKPGPYFLSKCFAPPELPLPPHRRGNPRTTPYASPPPRPKQLFEQEIGPAEDPDAH